MWSSDATQAGKIERLVPRGVGGHQQTDAAAAHGRVRRSGVKGSSAALAAAAARPPSNSTKSNFAASASRTPQQAARHQPENRPVGPNAIDVVPRKPAAQTLPQQGAKPRFFDDALAAAACKRSVPAQLRPGIRYVGDIRTTGDGIAVSVPRAQAYLKVAALPSTADPTHAGSKSSRWPTAPRCPRCSIARLRRSGH
jgi:hypothetical protein